MNRYEKNPAVLNFTYREVRLTSRSLCCFLVQKKKHCVLEIDVQQQVCEHVHEYQEQTASKLT